MSRSAEPSTSAAAAFDAFVAQAWADHVEQPHAVAERLRILTPAPQTGAQLSALARLAVHLCAEHLGDFDGARWRLEGLRGHPLAADAAAARTLRVQAAALDLAERGSARLQALPLDEQLMSEAAGAAIAIGRGHAERALALLASARGRIDALPGADPAVHRPLAVACNNIAWELQPRGDARTPEETAAMLDIAAASRRHWAQTGGWLEIERADYTLAMCHLSAGRPDDAHRHAQHCLAGCVDNGAPPHELLYAHEALARVAQARGDGAARAEHVAAAEAAYAALPPEERDGCASVVTALQALGR